MSLVYYRMSSKILQRLSGLRHNSMVVGQKEVAVMLSSRPKKCRYTIPAYTVSLRALDVQYMHATQLTCTVKTEPTGQVMHLTVSSPPSGYLQSDFCLHYLAKPNYSHQHLIEVFVHLVILEVFHQSPEENTETQPDQLYVQHTRNVM